MNAVPHIGRTISQRRHLHLVQQHGSVREYQRNQRQRIEGHVESLRMEQDRFEKTHADLQAEALLDRIMHAGTGECDEGMSPDPVTVAPSIQRLVLAVSAGVALGVLFGRWMGWTP
ncbi:hypothetical protein [Dyella lutea]|uniref:ElaB/YqjD/DUF883 family membrane-anchored ribosome-binding protein n=1 Tax=Dyella lutea TaxID=2950441 RepID=A0ABT1FF63_9GAMM|nr:hypothetical protein [Dyella lutea]MCP1376001.1 hypothetical protein [Dyella lutea]